MSSDRDIPEEFWSDLTGRPFTECTVCEKDLTRSGTPYMIEKAVRKQNGFTNTIFEYAICRSCAEQWTARLSRESLKSMRTYMSENAKPPVPRGGIATKEDMEAGLAACSVTGKPKDELEEYQIMCLCSGSRLSPFNTPWLISGEAMEDVTELLSDQTIDEMDDFMGEIYTGPPELKEFFKGRPVLV